MISVSFYQLLSKGNSKDFGPIYMRVKGLNRRLNFATGINESSKDWDKKKERFKQRHPNAFQLNERLDAMERKLLLFVEQSAKEQHPVTPESIKNYFNGKEEKTSKLIDCYSSFIQQHERSMSKGTIKQYKSVKCKLVYFVKDVYGINDLPLKQLDYAFVTKFKNHLEIHYHNHPNTVNKNITQLRSVINWTIKMGWLTQDPFKNFKSSTVPTVKPHLSIEEISIIEGYATANTNKSMVKDAFLFMCYTGLSYADLRNLKKEDIQLSINGGKIIKISRQKTMEYCMIPLIKKAETILDKYSNHPKVVNEGFAIPVISNQKMNDRLEDIRRELKISKKISCHVARHSFATNALELGVPIETVSKALGHRSIKTTQIYARITESKLNHDFELFAHGFIEEKKSVSKAI